MKFAQWFKVSLTGFVIAVMLTAPNSSFAGGHGGKKRKHNRDQQNNSQSNSYNNKKNRNSPDPQQQDQIPNNTVQTSGSMPDCLDAHGNTLGVDNDQVVLWKKTTQNQYLTRAHIKGTVGKVYDNRNGHNHFEALIGSGSDATIEVIYNAGFGDLPNVVPGMSVEACGDYITSNAATSAYPASPDDAIIHWIHRSNNVNNHQSGYVALNGTVYGQGSGR